MNKAAGPAISVIVAIYRAENYMRRCLESIRMQTFEDFEVLLIDDGSPDGSGDICEEYAAKDSRFRVFHKENGGVASARQCGLGNSRGEFIIHIDPDDWIELNMLEILYMKAVESGVDMVVCNIIAEEVLGPRPHTFCEDSREMFMLNVNRDHDYGYKYGLGLTNKLIRRQCYQGIKFPEQLRACEDSYVLVKMISNKVKIYTIPDYLYHYDQRVNNNSLTGYKTPGKRFFTDRINFLRIIASDNEILTPLKNTEIAKFAHTVFNYNLLSQWEYTKFFSPFVGNFWNAPVPLRRKFNILLSVMGFKWLIHYPYVTLKQRYLDFKYASK